MQNNVPIIFQKHILENVNEKNNVKIIVFVQTIDEIEETKMMISNWLQTACKLNKQKRKINIYDVHWKKHKQNNDIINNFEKHKQNNDIDIMISVNIFNEGLHLDGVSTVIFLRKTSSNIVYFQQIGRSLGNRNGDDIPIVIDLVNNCNNINNGYISLFKNIKDIKKSSVINENGEIDIRLKNGEILNIFDNVKNFQDIAKSVLKSYNINFGEPLSDIEIQYAINNSKIKYIEEIADDLNRCSVTISDLFQRLGIKGKKELESILTEADKKYIEENITKLSKRKISETLGKSYYQITKYAQEKGLIGRFSLNSLNKNEEKYIEENYKKFCATEMARQLKKPPYVVQCYMRRNGIKNCLKKSIPKRLTEKEKNFIKNNTHLSNKEISEKLGRNTQTISSFCNANNIVLKSERNVLSNEEKKFILENYKKINPSEIARRLGRIESVSGKPQCNVIKKFLKDNNLSALNGLCYNARMIPQEEIDIVLSYNKKATIKEMEKELNIPKARIKAIKRKIREIKRGENNVNK